MRAREGTGICYGAPRLHFFSWNPMPRTSPATASRSTAKATLAKAMARADQDGPAVLRAATQEAFKRVTLLLERSYPDFSADQQRRIRALVATEPTAPPAERIKRPAREPLPPRFWLPHSGATWSGRGRVPQAFLAWEGTVAHTEWKKHHPDQRFPTYPG